MDEAKTTTTPTTSAPAAGSARPAAGSRPYSGGGPRGGGGQRGGGRPGGGRGRSDREVKEFDQKTLDLSRVTRVTAGGKRMSFRAALVIGDKKGRVGFGVAKGSDVQISMEKAYRQAKKHMVKVPMQDGTIPHSVEMKFGSAVVLLKPAPKGTGLKSGGATRVVLELAGVPNAVSKVLNSSNKINIAKATLAALEALRMNPTKGKDKKAE